MPKIAQYEPDQVLTQVVKQPRFDGSAGVAAIQSNEKIAEGLTSLVQAGLDIKQQFDTTSAEEALVGFERGMNKTFFDPKNGYFNTQGKNAVDNADAANKALIDLKKKYGESLNQESKAMFDKAVTAHITRAQADISRHASKGLRDWDIATIKSRLETTIENASLYFNRSDKLTVQNELGRQAVLEAAKLEGVGPEATNKNLHDYDSTFAKTVILAALNSSSAEGSAKLNEYNDKLEPSDRIKLKKAIKIKIKAEKVRSDSQQAILSGSRLADQYDSREDIRNQVNKIRNPELRKKTMSEAMHQFNLKRQGESEERAEAFERAESYIIKGHSAESYQADDPDGWEKLDSKQKAVIESGKLITTNWNNYSDLITLPEDQLAKINPVDHFHDLAIAERKSLISAVKSAAGAGSSSDRIEHQVGRTRISQTNDAIEQILGKKAKWNEEKHKKSNVFQDLLDGEVKFREKEKGKHLTSQEFTDTLSDLTRKAIIKRDVFGIDFLVPDVKQSVTDMSQEESRMLSKFLRDNNIPVTAVNLLKAKQEFEK